MSLVFLMFSNVVRYFAFRTILYSTITDEYLIHKMLFYVQIVNLVSLMSFYEQQLLKQRMETGSVSTIQQPTKRAKKIPRLQCVFISAKKIEPLKLSHQDSLLVIVLYTLHLCSFQNFSECWTLCDFLMILVYNKLTCSKINDF